ncbi:MAG: SRPBCC family protein [Polyangiales bacterium]
MKIEADAFVDHPADEVFRAYRDVLPRLVEQIPQVRAVIVQSRKESGHIVELVNLWHGDSPVPTIAEKILPTRASWFDHASWDAAALEATWRIESEVFTDAIRCEGVNRFVAVGDHTRVEVRAEIRVDLSKLRLVPDMVAGPIGSAIERFFVKQFTPSVGTVCDAIGNYLDEQ